MKLLSHLHAAATTCHAEHRAECNNESGGIFPWMDDPSGDGRKENPMC
jgi:hypothetical protein